MTNLSGPAGSSASGFSNMPDVIDALKRLERIGDENSKTVAKIMQAAAELEAKIVGQYSQFDSGGGIDPNSILKNFAANRASSVAEAARELGVACKIWSPSKNLATTSLHSYFVNTDDGSISVKLDGLESEYTRVSETRDAALAFAADIARGLLGIFEADLAARQADNAVALDVLEQSLKSPKS